MLHVFLYCLVWLQSGSWPHGTYRTVVDVPLLPKQEIVISTYEKKRGMIQLAGVINTDEAFQYDKVNGKWTVAFGQRFLGILETFHGSLSEIDFDVEKDMATVWLSMPILGMRKIFLKKKSIF